MLRTAFALALCLSASVASAQQWAEKMFSERAFDFGSVAKAGKVEHQFVITNLYKDDVHIASVRSSCGCTQPRIGNKDTLKSHEQGAIIAAFNTRAFSGQRGATVTVTIDRPMYAEVTLNVRGYIRTDVVLDPNQVSFGSVSEGNSAHKKVRIEYAGRNDWKILGTKIASPYLSADVKEIGRNGNRTSYELDVELKPGAPAGYLQNQILVTTNDRRGTEFPVNVEGLIVADLTVSPTALMLGTLQPGQTVTKQLVVKGSKDFKIVEIRCHNDAFRFQPSDEAKAVHLVPMTFEAGDKLGNVNEKIEIVTDLGDHKTVELTAMGQISAPLAGK
ncbi:MAG TPA: DUF1573 domain-containing protein [Pirellulales bacterium]|nr:DUF1573 domain-containing protein [Pirellulales bacterium]